MSVAEPFGPFQSWPVSVNGYAVPHINVAPMADGTHYVTVDGRFGIHKSVTQEELDNWMPILAHAMAVAAGYSCHGENSQKINPYCVGVSKVSIPPNLTIV